MTNWPVRISMLEEPRPDVAMQLAPTSSAGSSNRDKFEAAVRPLPRYYGHISLRDNDDRPVASTSKLSRAVCEGCEYTTLDQFRAEDKDRNVRLHKLFDTLHDGAWHHGVASSKAQVAAGSAVEGQSARPLTAEERRQDLVRKEYLRELYHHCCSGDDHENGSGPSFDKFNAFVEEKEEALWELFCKIDADNDMLLTPSELRDALQQAGITVSQDTLQDMMREMDKNGKGRIDFAGWRDFLLLLPRQTSMSAVYNYWKSFSTPRLATSQATQDLDVLLAERPEKAPTTASKSNKGKERARDESQDQSHPSPHVKQDHEHDTTIQEDPDDDLNKPIFEGSGAYLLAGGLAGAVSRTATAPFDRLKVYLINHVEKSEVRLPGLAKTATHPLSAAKDFAKSGNKGVGAFMSAVKSLYIEGGFKAFFVGNGLNVIKIFPESAVKFWSYEYSKRWFARNVDHCSVAEISPSSRFIAGGLGGVVSQLLIYPLETWKTRVMSSTSASPTAKQGNALYADIAKDMWRKTGIKGYYKGLNMGLIGVFPYSAIDMSLFAFFKKTYVQYTGDEEPGPFGSLTFGAVSGGLGATSVNLLRTRLQTQGTIAHPNRYSGWRDVARQCYHNEGIKGFYKGLTPTLLKVSPSMGISWFVYEYSSTLFLPKHNDQHASTDSDTNSES